MAAVASGVFLEPSGRESCYVEPASLVEVAELIECSIEDLTPLRYGAAGVMWMSKPHQIDKDVPANKDATLVVQKFHHLPVLIRGAVVCFPRGEKFVTSTEA